MFAINSMYKYGKRYKENRCLCFIYNNCSLYILRNMDFNSDLIINIMYKYIYISILYWLVYNYFYNINHFFHKKKIQHPDLNPRRATSFLSINSEPNILDLILNLTSHTPYTFCIESNVACSGGHHR